MPVPTIFLVKDSGEIIDMADRPYSSEDLLQALVAKYPDVLAGDQMNGAPRAWLLVSREAGVPCEEGGGDRWSLDHLFIDQGGVPTLVEVKRSSDTRIRREVIGQMLDYAANAVLYWPTDFIRQRFEETCDGRGVDPREKLTEFLAAEEGAEPGAAIARFWNTVETNLRAGRIRLVFVADAIPPELRRVIEFLNSQMQPAEVLGIEIRQYVGTGVRTLVPSVIGGPKRTASAEQRSAVQWDRESFLAALARRRDPAAAAVAEKILDRAAGCLPRLWWGEGRQDGSCFCGFTHAGESYYPFALWTYGRVEMQFQWLQRRLGSLALIPQLAARLNDIPGVQIPPDALSRRPAFDLMVLKEPSALTKFFAALEWFVAQITST